MWFQPMHGTDTEGAYLCTETTKGGAREKPKKQGVVPKEKHISAEESKERRLKPFELLYVCRLLSPCA